jgi:hypothetical protein
VDAQASLNDIKHINLAVVLQGIKAKNDKTSIRKRVREVGEFHLTSTGKINSNRLYTYLPDEDKTVRVNEPEELFSALMKNVAMNKDEIVAEIGKKKSIIDWLVRCDTEDIEVLGQIIQAYYKNPERIEQAAQTMLNPMEVIGDDVCWVEPSGAEVE